MGCVTGAQLDAMLRPRKSCRQEWRMAHPRGFVPYASGLVVPFEAAA